MPLSMPLSWTESLDHLEHVMDPCWCFWAGPDHHVKLLDRVKNLQKHSRGMCLCWGKLSGESEFRKDLRYRSE
jgi:hypothetical protein